jgi:pimeloyl-ACP methyl ester carboxylesterase
MFTTSLPETRTIAGVTTELLIKGTGQPLLFLHAGHGFEVDDPLVEALSAHYRVIAASHPGFGATARPDTMTSVDDLAFFYLDLMESLDLQDLIVVGVSFGGWIAAELATRGTGRISKLVLIDALGAKFSDRETRDIADMFAITVGETPDLFFHDSQRGTAILSGLDFKALPLAAATRFARNREAMVLFGWSPTLYNPKLVSRLHRVKVPVLVLWGANDKVVAPEYGRKYAAAFADGRFEQIADAGHYGYLERPQKFADAVLAFLDAKMLVAA